MSTEVDAADLLAAVRRIADTGPDRVVVRYHHRTLTYRELASAIDLMVPVTRSQSMDDRAAVVAAVFAGMPALSSECDPATVAAVVDGTFARVFADLAELDDASNAPKGALRTNEIDLRDIASRLAAS
ncbi:hypothetical protein [Williamsia sp. CHRR-6]|uniref:hypothetical protein n=1 Tax=Williamsia sp. CHRR-6 TaxID=2835871 RepID=UPI001BD93F57|nr:hypothetical protein [Williamsia sp. CHRR-6]MBT0565774.1 hypothetical protein [Williamsia sp. CHRR-6]